MTGYQAVRPYAHDEGCHREARGYRRGQLDTRHCRRCIALAARIHLAGESCPLPARRRP